jgi:hypothetical protein
MKSLVTGEGLNSEGRKRKNIRNYEKRSRKQKSKEKQGH